MQILAVAGQAGGTLSVPLASSPQTFNPVLATDNASQELASLTMADLMHINPHTLQVEPALATSVVHRSPTVWIVHLRQGVRFSDGVPFTAADVAFSFRVYTDPKLDAPGRALLIAHGQPVRCKILNPSTVELDLPAPMAVGDRLLDSVWMLPRHLLLASYHSGHFAAAWPLGTPPAAMAGLGAFQITHFESGLALELGPNPNYWRTDRNHHRLPYLNRLQLRILQDANLRITLFARGQLDGLSRLDSSDYAHLHGNPCCRLYDAGAGLNPEMLVLNQTPGPQPARSWFREPRFRQAVSFAIDRENLIRNVYDGKASALASLTSPSEGRWADPTPPARQNLPRARTLLRACGFSWRGTQLLDAHGRPVAFSLITPAGNAARGQIAVYIQADLRRLGMEVAVTPLPFNSYLDRLAHRRDFGAALLGISIPDADPNVESSEWTLGGGGHFWNLDPAHPQPWAVALDRWFQRQLTSTDPAARLDDYRRIQAIEREQLPMIPLVAPDILVAARPDLQGVEPALLPPHLLWNADRLWWRRR
ncbi:MAG: ABC transporter substrate-binding protein [Terriglobales bacterium]